MPEHVPGPSRAGSVVLDLGAGIGALILDAPAELNGREIEISPAGGGLGSPRTHSLVRERRTGAGTGYAAVYPGLAEGVYTIWRDAEAPAATVTIASGRVTSYRWLAAPPREPDRAPHPSQRSQGPHGTAPTAPRQPCP
jgi:hypothetical protein